MSCWSLPKPPRNDAPFSRWCFPGGLRKGFGWWLCSKPVELGSFISWFLGNLRIHTSQLLSWKGLVVLPWTWREIRITKVAPCDGKTYSEELAQATKLNSPSFVSQFSCGHAKQESFPLGTSKMGEYTLPLAALEHDAFLQLHLSQPCTSSIFDTIKSIENQLWWWTLVTWFLC